MTAKEFFEQNRGKYFKHSDDVVRVVGYNDYSILTAGEKGWSYYKDMKQGIRYIDESLINKEDKLWFTNFELLTSIEQPELDLCEILKGCEGVELWSDIFGKCRFESLDDDGDYEIVVSVFNTNSGNNKYEQFTKYGRFYDCYPDGKCILWPSETNRDWSTFKKPIKEGIPCMCKNSDSDIWVLRTERQASYTYCVPVENFDFKDIESNISRSIV